MTFTKKNSAWKMGTSKKGRPKGTPDFRPFIHKVLHQYFVVDCVANDWAALRKKLTPKEKLWFDIELAKLGVQASPKQLDQASSMTVTLVIGGRPQEVRGELIEDKPIAGVLQGSTPVILSDDDDDGNNPSE